MIASTQRSVSHPVKAHTDGDAVVHFTDIDVIHAGDILFNGIYPFIDIDSGGSVDGYIEAVAALAEMAGSETVIISGHGPVASREDVLANLDMLKTARAAVQELIDQGMSLGQVLEADPLAELNADYAWFFITGPRMTEILYRGLSRS